MRNPISALQARFESWPDELLSVALLTVAAGLALLALQRDHEWLKAAALAWVLFP